MTANLNVRYDYEPFLDYYNVTIDYPKQFLNYNEALDYYSVHFEYNRPIEGLDCDEWVEKREDALSFDFELDSIELSSQGQYFFGCSFDIYKNTYSDRYISYLSDFPDANEIDFCNYELKKKLEYVCSDKLNEKMSFSIKKRNEFLNEKIGGAKILINESEAKNLNNTSTTITLKNFDPNHFNNDCHNLFNYLVDNYKKKGKIKYINIYYFLKDEVDKQKYSFNFIQDDYTIFIKAKHQIEIKKYQKAEYDFIEQKRILNSHEEQFRKH